MLLHLIYVELKINGAYLIYFDIKSQNFKSLQFLTFEAVA
jgi:hypothetical protein